MLCLLPDGHFVWVYFGGLGHDPNEFWMQMIPVGVEHIVDGHLSPGDVALHFGLLLSGAVQQGPVEKDQRVLEVAHVVKSLACQSIS